jgi:hypothetical protein
MRMSISTTVGAKRRLLDCLDAVAARRRPRCLLAGEQHLKACAHHRLVVRDQHRIVTCCPSEGACIEDEATVRRRSGRHLPP